MKRKEVKRKKNGLKYNRNVKKKKMNVGECNNKRSK